MRLCVARRQTDKRRAGICIEMRRAFAHQIRQPDRAVRARRNFCRFIYKRIITCAFAEIFAKPFERKSRALRDARIMPASGNRMAKRVNSPFQINFRRSMI